jgi:pyruvate dehydrogenase (quinone)
MAAFMASAHAKFHRRGPFLLRDFGTRRDPSPERSLRRQDGPCARRRHCRQARTAIGACYQQEGDLQSLFKDLALRRRYGGNAGPGGHPIDRAIRIASTRRFVTCVIIRNDLKELAYQDTPVARCTHTGVGHAGPAMLPSDTLLREAAAVLNAGKKIGILVGAGALGTADEVIAVAKKLRSLEEHSH